MVKNTIAINYQADKRSPEYSITVNYEIDIADNVQTIACCITQQKDLAMPSWCQPKKFTVRSLYTNGMYTQLYNEQKEIRYIDMELFIEKAYADIMKKERKMSELV